MDLPELSHLQFALIGCLGSQRRSGKELRGLLKGEGHNKSGPGFYQMMARLEKSKFVSSEIEQKIVHGQIIKERFYRLTGQGAAAYNSTIDFYDARSRKVVCYGV